MSTIKTQEQDVKYALLRIKTPERRHWRRSGVLMINSEHISHFVSVFLLLTLNRQMPIENFHFLANSQAPIYSLCILTKILTSSIRIPIFNWYFVYVFETLTLYATSNRRWNDVLCLQGRGLNFVLLVKFKQTFLVCTQI